MEGCSSPLEEGEMDEPGLGCRLVKDELPWTEEPPAGVGWRSPALPPPVIEVWSKFAPEVGGAEREERPLEAASKEVGRTRSRRRRQCERVQ